jgi:Ca2+-binding EF-hand superfamily protein
VYTDARDMAFEYRPMDDEMVRNITEAFRKYDFDGCGALTRHGLKCAIASLVGIRPSPLELDAILPKRRRPPNERVDEEALEPTIGFEAFATAMRNRLCAVDETDVIRQTFRAYDATFKGYITYDDFARAFALTAPHIPAETLRLVFDEVDTDRNGKVSWAEFERVQRYRAHKLDAQAPRSTAHHGGAQARTQGPRLFGVERRTSLRNA